MFFVKKIRKVLSVIVVLGIIALCGAVVIALFFSPKQSNIDVRSLDINTIGKNENYPIDLVYLWCEDNPQREKLRNEWKEKLGIMKNKNTNSLQATNKGRFVSNDELKYSLRSVEKYAPWINKIYIITDNQAPKWLNLNHPKIKIIDHKDIMPASARPSFNSVSIEHCISNIKDLSEHFLYANDDMMFGNYVQPEDFFKDGKPIYILGGKIFGFMKRIYIKITGKSDISKFQFGKTIVNAYNLVNKQFTNTTLDLRYPHHNIDPYLKSTMKKVKETFKDEIETTINSHFRSDVNIQRMVYTFYAILNNEAYYKIQEKHDRIYNIKSIILGQKRKISYYVGINKINKLPEELKKYKYKMFCTNDNEDTTDADRAKYRDIMEQIFPYKSSFEK